MESGTDPKQKKSPLGRGLQSLIPVSPLDRELVHRIKLSDIKANRYQPRSEFIEEKLKDLELSIKENGVIQPIIVRKMQAGYELIAGERRFIAAQRAGLNEIPAIVKNVNDLKALELALIENIQRADLNPIEEARGYLMLSEEFNLSHEDIARQVGKSRTAITNALRLLKLPPKIQHALQDGSFTVGHAKVVLGLEDQDAQLDVFRQIVRNSFNVRNAEKLVQALKSPDKKTVVPSLTDPDLKQAFGEVTGALRSKLKSRVEIKWNDTSGRLIIHFNSRKELEHIAKHFQ